MVKIYTDANILRRFGSAFATRTLPEDLPVQLLLSPLALMAVLAQLGTDQAQEAFEAVQALPRVHNQGPTGMLPWTDDFFRMALFDQPSGNDVITPALNKAVNNVLNATGPEVLRSNGEEMRALLEREKNAAAENFSALLNSWRAEGPLPETEHQSIFARSIARRAGMDESSVDVDEVVSRLNAHYIFEKERIEAGGSTDDYNFAGRANDLYDAELLIYLADPSLRLLTYDRGFRRVRQSAQANRIHIETLNSLQDADRIIDTLGRIVRAAEDEN
jgi:hypothetical protein